LNFPAVIARCAQPALDAEDTGRFVVVVRFATGVLVVAFGVVAGGVVVGSGPAVNGVETGGGEEDGTLVTGAARCPHAASATPSKAPTNVRATGILMWTKSCEFIRALRRRGR
jgi:hypothetical protein